MSGNSNYKPVLRTFSYANSVIAITPEGSVPIIFIDHKNHSELVRSFATAEKISKILNEDPEHRKLFLGILNYN